MTHLPILIPLLPLSASLLSVLLSMLHKKLGQYCVIASLAGSLLCGCLLVYRLFQGGGEAIHYWMGNWPPPFGIEFVIDPVNAVVILVIALLAIATAIYAQPFLKEKNWLQTGGFYTLLGLLAVGLFGMTLTGDVFNLYVFLEISSLSCYGLISLGGNKATVAAFRYLLIGTIGASLYLLGIGLLYAMTGSLNMADLSQLLQGQMSSPLVVLAILCLMGAFGIKMALFPFHGWQPDAYTYAHPAAAPLISGAMSKVPAYAMIRFFFYLFGLDSVVVAYATQIIGVCGAIAMIYGSAMAIAQTDFRRMLAYSSVAQLGYIALGIGIGNAYGLAGSLLHIINHAFMKGGLFLAIGAVQYRFGVTDIRHLGQLHRKMPWTCFTIVIAALSMVGIPPTGGFFSKWYLMLGAIEGAQYVYVAVLVVSTLLNAIYFLRILENIFINSEEMLEEQLPDTGKLELPVSMLVPVVLFGAAILVIGFLNGTIVKDMILVGLQGVMLR